MADKIFAGLQLPNMQSGDGVARESDEGFMRLFFKEETLYAIDENGDVYRIGNSVKINPNNPVYD
jgi:hypothetical protein